METFDDIVLLVLSSLDYDESVLVEVKRKKSVGMNFSSYASTLYTPTPTLSTVN